MDTASRAAADRLADAVQSAGWATSINVAKNLVRVVSPLVQPRRPDGLINRKWSDLASTMQMALMTATITLLVPAFEKAANELVNYARNPRLPTAASLRWPSFLRPQLQLPPIDELSV